MLLISIYRRHIISAITKVAKGAAKALIRIRRLLLMSIYRRHIIYAITEVANWPRGNRNINQNYIYASHVNLLETRHFSYNWGVQRAAKTLIRIRCLVLLMSIYRRRTRLFSYNWGGQEAAETLIRIKHLLLMLIFQRHVISAITEVAKGSRNINQNYRWEGQDFCKSFLRSFSRGCI